jgi:hypothetical protein
MAELIWGTADAEGTIVSGSRDPNNTNDFLFTCKKDSSGTYTVTYKKPNQWSHPPAVSITCIHGDDGDSHVMCADLRHSTTSEFHFIMRSTDSQSHVTECFSFMVMGDS